MPDNLHCCTVAQVQVQVQVAIHIQIPLQLQIADSEKMKIDALHLKRPVIISQASIALHLPHRPKYVRDLHLMLLLPLPLLMDIYIKVPAPFSPLSVCLPLCCTHCTHCGPTGRMRIFPATLLPLARVGNYLDAAF